SNGPTSVPGRPGVAAAPQGPGIMSKLLLPSALGGVALAATLAAVVSANKSVALAQQISGSQHDTATVNEMFHQRSTYATLSIAGYATAAAAAVGSGYFFYKVLKARPHQIQVTPSLSPQAPGVSISGRF